jgi:signal transduction histidine kinase
MNALSDHLSSLISEISDFSKIQTSDFQLNLELFDVTAFLQSIQCIAEIKSKAKGVNLTLHIAHDTPAIIRGDMLRVRQICINLLDNAVKFTPTGGRVRFIVSKESTNDTALQHQDNQFMLCIIVSDTGIGMSVDEVANIFKSFTQADMSTTRHYGGAGLGLSICYNLTRFMNGRINVKSEKGQGTTFIVRIQVASPHEPSVTEQSSPDCLSSEQFIKDTLMHFKEKKYVQ